MNKRTTKTYATIITNKTHQTQTLHIHRRTQTTETNENASLCNHSKSVNGPDIQLAIFEETQFNPL